MQKDALMDIGHSVDQDMKENGMERTHKPDGELNHVAGLMMINFRESRHPVFRGSSALNRGTSKSKGGGKLLIYYCDDSDTAELIFRTSVSVNQLSIYGAVSDWCEELAQRISDYSVTGAGRPAQKDKPESMMAPTAVPTSTDPLRTKRPEQGNLPRQYRRKFSKLPDDIQVIKTCTDAGFTKTVSQGQYFVTIHDVEMAKLD